MSIDLEVSHKTNQIYSFAAVPGNGQESFVFKRGKLEQALEELDRFVEPADFLLGHNFIHFDAQHLQNINSNLKLLQKPIIDTLWLNPLAFPRKPYHKLVKHYQDGRLQEKQANDPEQDAQLVLTVLHNQLEKFCTFEQDNPKLTCAYHYLVTTLPDYAGFDELFALVRGGQRPQAEETQKAIRELLDGKACIHQSDTVITQADQEGWSLAYALSWISVTDDDDSVMSPWVRHRFREASRLVTYLRDTPCTDPSCTWCRTQNDPKELLNQWFGFKTFQSRPEAPDGRSLQEVITESAMQKTSLLGILPTGTGKSICYQLSALSLFKKTGALTVVISPLVALMADQVAGMQRQGISSAVTINGMLSLQERHDTLHKIEQGEAAILLISPEQLRSKSVRTMLNQREVGYWVLDEAHCISKWGHDFRPDYRYVGRFIKEYSGRTDPAPIICLTATAKPDVIEDIMEHFRTNLGVSLKLLDGGTQRENLAFKILPTDDNKKHGDVTKVLEENLPETGTAGAIVYCSTRSATEGIASFLKEKGFEAKHYHAGLKPEEKREVQNAFTDGELRVIAATNAFGMGIDKPDIRLVVHADIPGSLENYLQEAGRAGRDREQALCVLLYGENDIERQFRLSARSRLTRREISAILKSVRRLGQRTKQDHEVVATPGEIVREEKDYEFQRDSATDDTRVKTAVSWLEEANLLKRDENRVNVFPSSLQIRTYVEACEMIDQCDIIDQKVLEPEYKFKLKGLVQSIINAPSDKGLSTDELCGMSSFSPAGLRGALYHLEKIKIASNDTEITVFVHLGVEDSSRKRLADVNGIETVLIAKLREIAPDLDLCVPTKLDHGATKFSHVATRLNLKIASQELRDAGHVTIRPDIVDRLIRGIGRDGRDEDDGKGGSLQVRKIDREHLLVRLRRSWDKLTATSERRRLAAKVILNFLEGKAPRQARGKDIQVETTLGDLTQALTNDMELQDSMVDPAKLLDRSLLWLHEQGVLTLGKGLIIFRPAMTINLTPGHQKFTDPDFETLSQHYQEQALQTHIMCAYAERGIKSITDASNLASEYFKLDKDSFVQKWLPGKIEDIQRQTTPKSWQAIVESLRNRTQAQIVTDKREQTNVLVLAGPGSGKTRVLVHRIAYLIRVKRENPNGILVLVYNRHSADDIRKRLFELIGDDVRGLTISTCHGFAMRMIGASFAKRAEKVESDDFKKIITDAVALLKGKGLERDEAEAQRDTLIEGYRWILVDEYQDVGPEEYELIAAIAGRSVEDEDRRLSLFAVGDDDQNIYAFSGASVEYIHRFEEDYKARPSYLVENYRSTANIIRASNHVIAEAAERMKTGHDICINQVRKGAPPGGNLERIDSVSRGRVQILKNAGNKYTQAVFAIKEIERLKALNEVEWDWSKVAVIARKWEYLNPVRSYCEAQGIPVESANEKRPNFWRLQETQALVTWLEGREKSSLCVSELKQWMAEQPEGVWWSVLRKGVNNFAQEIGDCETDRGDVREWLAEWGRDMRKSHNGLLLLSAHRAKGLEFDHVVVLDGGWDKHSKGEDCDAERRLYYVAMTRARRSLAFALMGRSHPILQNVKDNDAFLGRKCDPDSVDTSECRKLYVNLDSSEVFLSFAGRLKDGHPSLAAISKMEVGDPVKLKKDKDRWIITNRNNVKIGSLAEKFTPPTNAKFLSGSVHAIIKCFRKDSSEEYRSKLKRDSWDVILPELVFEPVANSKM